MAFFGKGDSVAGISIISENEVKDVPLLKFVEQYACVVFYQGTLVLADIDAPPLSSCSESNGRMVSYDKLKIGLTHAPAGTICDLLIQECEGYSNNGKQKGTIYKARNIRFKS